jgi:hypothetical protein
MNDEYNRELFVWAYRKLPTQHVRLTLLPRLNRATAWDGDEYKGEVIVGEFDEKLQRELKIMENIIVSNCDVHPVECIEVYSWYIQFTSVPFKIYDVEKEARDRRQTFMKMDAAWDKKIAKKRKKLVRIRISRRHEYEMLWDSDDERDSYLYSQEYLTGQDLDDEEIDNEVSTDDE